ncbi:MAG: tRNA lysidine(34) synthetase TilS [Actinobacteria bacterium]|nr:tRNA lysidine(34) synthetase TilS [Actinomycetota bacterium]
MKEIYSCKFARDEIIIKALKTIESSSMIKSGDRILISISGGSDSTFLTHLLYLMRPVLNLILFGFCLDHMTRNGESEKDALFVEKLCRELDIELFRQKIDVQKWCRENKLSFQEGARKLRMEKLLEISKENNIERIATGHNADDNIETFLMHLVRGAGARGLSGIKPVSGKFIRPLIDIFRKDIIAYLDNKKISYCVDRTNIENIYLRNRVRNILIPFISKHFLESFKSNVLRSINILKDEDEFLREYSVVKLAEIASIEKSKISKYAALIKIPVLKIKGEARAVQRRIVLAAIEMINGTLENISFNNIDDILGICTSGGESKVIQPEEKIRVFKIGSYIYFVNVDYIRLLPDEFKQFLKSNGKVDTEKSGKEIKVGTKIKLKDFNLELSSELLKIGKDKIKFNEVKNTEAFLDYAKIKPPIKVRIWKRGDKFYPLGMQKEKKLQDFFINSKIPIHLRKLVPVFIDREKIIWVGKYRIDNRVRITEDTKEVLHLKLF